jgi:hypothetical protein
VTTTAWPVVVSTFLLALAGCAPTPAAGPPPTAAIPTYEPPAPPPVTPPTAGADGAACTQPVDCASGVCEGQGCGADTPGVCVAAQRACTKDLREYCGCDGQRFRASGSCPGRRYQDGSACGPAVGFADDPE